jgi:hypothetical protein
MTVKSSLFESNGAVAQVFIALVAINTVANACCSQKFAAPFSGHPCAVSLTHSKESAVESA